MSDGWVPVFPRSEQRKRHAVELVAGPRDGDVLEVDDLDVPIVFRARIMDPADDGRGTFVFVTRRDADETAWGDLEPAHVYRRRPDADDPDRPVPFDYMPATAV